MMKRLAIILLFPIALYAHEPDRIEHLFGATNINAFVGNGGLSVGISSKGEITVLKWPSPSYYDHLNYQTAIVPVDAGYHAQDLPHMGAKENMGIFAGVKKNGSVIWLRDLEVYQEYLSEDDNVVLIHFIFPDGAEVVQENFVHPTTDVLVFHFSAKGAFESLLFYENTAPCINKIYMLPIADWLGDSNNDFFAFYEPESDTLFHFTLAEKDLNALNEIFQKKSSERESVLKVFLNRWKNEEGIWIAIAGDSSPISHQVGHDSMTPCSESKGWIEEPQDAYLDTADGILSGSSYGGCQVNSVMEYPFDRKLTIFIAVGDSYTEAKDKIIWARERGYERLKEDTLSYWRNWISKAALPAKDEFIPFSKRTLINIKASTDRETGAIVASISVQPPYGEDWPRDGVYLNLALDVAGYHSDVTRHNEFYVKVQRRNGLFPFLPGSYDMCYYADGMPGGPIPFEIDETAYIIWGLWNHVKFLPESEREDYISKVSDAIELASDSLYANCFDSLKKLQCYSNEDDNPEFTQGLKGAVTYYLAMKTAAEYWGYKGDERKAKIFTKRAEDIKEGIMNNFYLPEEGMFGSTFSPVSALIWPGELEAEYDRESVIRWIQGVVDRSLAGEVEGFSYISKGILAVAVTEREKYRSWLEEVVSKLILSVPTPETMLMGETVVVVDGNFENRVSMPHNWEAALAYLSAMALYNPESFEPLNEKIESKTSGCATVNGDFSIPLFLILYIGWAWKRKHS